MVSIVWRKYRRRVYATCIDYTIFSLPIVPWAFFLVGTGIASPLWAYGVQNIIFYYFILFPLFLSACEFLFSKTPGKHLWGLTIIKKHHWKWLFLQFWVRNLVKLVSILVPVMYLYIDSHPKYRSFHNIISGLRIKSTRKRP